MLSKLITADGKHTVGTVDLDQAVDVVVLGELDQRFFVCDSASLDTDSPWYREASVAFVPLRRLKK